MNQLKHFTYARNVLYNCILLLFLHVHLILFKSILCRIIQVVFVSTGNCERWSIVKCLLTVSICCDGQKFPQTQDIQKIQTMVSEVQAAKALWDDLKMSRQI